MMDKAMQDAIREAVYAAMRVADIRAISWFPSNAREGLGG